MRDTMRVGGNGGQFTGIKETVPLVDTAVQVKQTVVVVPSLVPDRGSHNFCESRKRL